MLPILYIIIPCYNEEKVLPITAPVFKDELMHLIQVKKISTESKILFVNDGSKDKTWDIICDLSKQDSCFVGIAQSRNRGHQNAVLAGLMTAKERCDITISIDCDGQDDVSAMEQMVDAYRQGCDIVYGVRSNRMTDTFFKRFTAQTFYKLLNKLGGDVVYNHADYRLVSRRALEAFSQFKETNLFLRGMFPMVGFKTDEVYYERNERLEGETHYPLHKMIGLAVDGITGMSVKPIHFVLMAGVGFGIISLVAFVLAIIGCYTMIDSKLMIVLGATFLIGTIQLLCLGIVGEYIGKTYMEVKSRPRYIISMHTENFPDVDMME